MKAAKDKSLTLLNFLKDISTLKRKRIPAYGDGDRVLWFADIRADGSNIRSIFSESNPSDSPERWLEVRKKRAPVQPAPPEIVKDWIVPESLDEFRKQPTLRSQITVLVEINDDQSEASAEGIAGRRKLPEVRRLDDYPEVQSAWSQYLQTKWKPWAEEMLKYDEVQRVYENVDYMRRRQEEAAERYELTLGLGLITWRDNKSDENIKRHVLTAPAEIALDASRGILTVGPAASFDKFRVELNMLEFQNQPRLDKALIDEFLEELDVEVWNRAQIGRILREIANRASAQAQVDENAFDPPIRADDTFRVTYSPAIILRERQPTAYDELVQRFLQDAEADPVDLTPPWLRFVSEGNPMPGERLEPSNINFSRLDIGRLYFPLATNEEQRQIAVRLQRQPYVLVKGPPGTGKSHTIANLICHLLASGERILVTAHAPKALEVLRNLLPEDLRDLCVTTFGSTREDHRILEDSVRGIIARKNHWKGAEWAHNKISEIEDRLRRLEGRMTQVERDLREIREAETFEHVVNRNYKGTAAQVARLVVEQETKFDWFPELSHDTPACPLQPGEVQILADIHGSLAAAKLHELELELGEASLPERAEFESAINYVSATEAAAGLATNGIAASDLNAFAHLDDGNLETCESFLKIVDEHAAIADRVLGEVAREILADLLVGNDERWHVIAENARTILDLLQAARQKIVGAAIEIGNYVSDQQLIHDLRRRIEHLRGKGWRGFGIMAPKVMRGTRYLEKCCTIDGRSPHKIEDLEKICAFLELRTTVETFQKIWPSKIFVDRNNPTSAIASIESLVGVLSRLTDLFTRRPPNALDAVSFGERAELMSPSARARWLSLLRAEIARRKAAAARAPIERWQASLDQIIACGAAHPCISELAAAVMERNPEKWRRALEVREKIQKEKERLQSYRNLIHKIEAISPPLARMIKETQGMPEWRDRLLQLQNAWDWAAAKVWLKKISDPDAYDRLTKQQRRLQEEIEHTVKELAALKAWLAFFQRLDDRTEQNLIAWTRAVARIGKGTGRFAYRHRKSAREYLMACLPKIPAWVMPLHKVWESIEPKPGVFDTVIIDEASQAGVEALLLLLLAKRIIVVGDDKQNSPEAVGVAEEDIARLARDHLRAWQFRDEFRPDTSLFDHAHRAFGNLISLREHFRCVPEIIRFSNDLCYTDAPLDPLRQAPPKRLMPLKSVFVDTGFCEGDGQWITNHAEAEAIVKHIQECLDDEAYKDKTMGVIVLQGHAQATLIEKRLAETLEPKVREERHIRCGVPATFQGDQRDVIFLSLVVAPNHKSRALTGQADQRRFNVAMSRARDQVWLFHSVREHELNREDLRWRLLNFIANPDRSALDQVYEQLERLEREIRRTQRELGNQPGPYGSWFEVDVAVELMRRKYRLRPQVELAGYRIDLIIEGMQNRLAVECDGELWHGPDQFDRDMARQRQLERAGLRFVRIRESEFYTNREYAIARVAAACEELGIRPL
ncbi:MAG TPA: AAA domain-containing protein [Xanthobacteraceae bacterium]|nr:AAA domain-containing protein [Xanthobacteraceae bacterium]